MKLFLKELLIFFAIPAAMVCILFVFFSYKNTEFLENYKVPAGVNTLIIGDSHTQYAINDSIFPHALNISEKSEGYFYSYPIIKSILDKNPNIKTVMLGYSFHNISSYYDASIYGEDALYSFNNFFFMLPAKQKLEFLYKNKLFVLRSLKSILYQGFSNLNHAEGKGSFIGSFDHYQTAIQIDSMRVNERINDLYFSHGKLNGFSSVQFSWLQKITDLCNDRKVRLILLNTPMHKLYLQKVPTEFINKYYLFIKFNNIKYFQFNKLQLTDSCFLPDGDHLRATGGTLATKYLLNNLDSITKQ